MRRFKSVEVLFRMQCLVRSCNRLGWEHKTVDEEKYFLAAQELLQYVALVTLCELPKHYLLGLHRLLLRNIFSGNFTFLRSGGTLGHGDLCLDAPRHNIFLGLQH